MQYSLSGKVVSLVVRDVHTTFGSVYPADSKSTENTIEALQSFVGDSPIKRFYSDNADELISAARHLHVPHEASQQGIPQTNGIIEREVQDMLTGTRTLLVAAGMPGYFWSYAAPCYMRLDNCVPPPEDWADSLVSTVWGRIHRTTYSIRIRRHIQTFPHKVQNG